MDNCPFWSTSNKKVKCYSECPIHNSFEEQCIFKTYLDSDDIKIKGLHDAIKADKPYNDDYCFCKIKL